MIQLRDAARIVGQPNIIHSFFMIVKAAPSSGNALVFEALQSVLSPAASRFRNILYAVQ